MKTLTLFIFLSIAPYFGFSQDKKDEQEKAASFSLFKNKDLNIDLKYIDPDKGAFGIDYNFKLERTLMKENAGIRKLNLDLTSQGFITVKGNDNNNNSIISELKLEGFPVLLIERKAKDVNKSWEDYIDDSTTDVANDPLINWSRSRAAQVAAPFWMFLDIHAKHESTQDFRDYDFALGGNLSFSSSFISTLLDYPFGLLRGEGYNNPSQFSASVGYDFVNGINKTKLQEFSDSVNHLNRLNIKAEWQTGVLTDRDRISFAFDSYYHFDNRSRLEVAEKKWNYFYQIKFEHLLYYNKNSHTLVKMSVKYTHGGLPPNFDVGYVLGGGFSIDF